MDREAPDSLADFELLQVRACVCVEGMCVGDSSWRGYLTAWEPRRSERGV